MITELLFGGTKNCFPKSKAINELTWPAKSFHLVNMNIYTRWASFSYVGTTVPMINGHAIFGERGIYSRKWLIDFIFGLIMWACIWELVKQCIDELILKRTAGSQKQLSGSKVYMKGNFIYLVANRGKKGTIPEKHKWEKNFNN